MKIQNLRGWGKLLNYSKTSKNKNFAFSLIELSIVLIIIGLLVAGVTGGASLIESAKIRRAITEFNNIKVGFNAFYTAKDRVPGDLNNDGATAVCEGAACPSTADTAPAGTFEAPYDNVAVGPSFMPFVEMALEGTIDFQPDPKADFKYSGGKMISSTECCVIGEYRGVVTPEITFPKGTTIREIRTILNVKNTEPHYAGLKDGYYLFFMNGGSTFSEWSSGAGRAKTKDMQKLDMKIDDGKAFEGFLRVWCNRKEYDELEANDKTCQEALYKIMESL